MPLDRRVLLRTAAVMPLAGLAACGSQEGSGPVSPSARASSSPSSSSSSRASSAAGSSSAASPSAPTPSAETGPPTPRIAETLAQDLDVPWGLAFLPDGTALVSCRDSFEVVRVGRRRTRVVGRVPGVVTTVSSGGEGGLLGLALHPDFPRQRWLYAYRTTSSGNEVVRMRLPRSLDGLGEPEVILEGIHTSLHHNGGGLRFGTDGLLFVSTGDAEDPAAAQDTGSLNGKILRITDTGGVPPGNPFGNEVWTYGHRNVEGLALDARGQLWASEFGDKAYDEVNRIVKGGDYGWPDVEGSDGPGGYRDPIAQWPTSACSPSGIAITRGRAWLGALQGECVWSVDLASGTTRRHLDGHGRLRLVATAPDGSLWVGTSHRDGRASSSAGDDRIFRVTL